MLGKIIELSIRNKFMIILMTAFMIAYGIYSMMNTTIDALPDLSDVQVIIYTEYGGQSPRIVEDQVTYPLTTAMVSVPGSKVVRGYSFFGYSLVYVIFEDGTDIYWARSPDQRHERNLGNDWEDCGRKGARPRLQSLVWHVWRSGLSRLQFDKEP